MTTNNAINSNHNGVSGSAKFVGDTNATLITPLLGTPTSGTLTNCTGLPLTSGVTGLLLAASLLPFGANNTKIVFFNHDISLTGTQTITGVGFTPSLVIFFGSVNTQNTLSMGIDNGSTIINTYRNATDGTYHAGNKSIFLSLSGTTNNAASITSFNSDGFVITWAKTGSPTGTGQVTALCFV